MFTLYSKFTPFSAKFNAISSKLTGNGDLCVRAPDLEMCVCVCVFNSMSCGGKRKITYK